MAVLLWSEERFQITIERLARQLVEQHEDFTNSALIGLQPRGVYLARQLKKRLSTLLDREAIPYGELDATFYRDDFRRRDEPLKPLESNIDFQLEGKDVILVDDVLYTGRTVRAGLDALHDYVGIQVDTRSSQNVTVEWAELDGADRIWLLDEA